MMTESEAQELIAEIKKAYVAELGVDMPELKHTSYTFEKIINRFVEASQQPSVSEVQKLQQNIKDIHVFLDTCCCPAGCLMGEAPWRKNNK